MDELSTIEEVSADENSIGDGMGKMYDLWSDDTSYCLVSTAAQTDMEAKKKPEQGTKETQMETETKAAEVQTSGTQEERQMGERGDQTGEIKEKKEVTVTIYRSQKEVHEWGTQTEEVNQLSVSKVFNVEESAMTAYGHITRRVEGNMCWSVKLGDFMEIGGWRKPFECYRLVAYEFKLGRITNLWKIQFVAFS